MRSHVEKLLDENDHHIKEIKKVIFVDRKNDIKRIILLFIYILFAFFVHNRAINYKLEMLSATIILIIFLGILVYEYKSLFKKNLPKLEYFTNIFFIIIFTVFLFATIYSVKIEEENTSYFIQNGEKEQLSYSVFIFLL